MWHNAHPNPDKKHDMKPIENLMEKSRSELEEQLPKKKIVEYLSTIQGDMYKVGQRLKAVREANGIELKDIAHRDDAERLERGIFTNNVGQPLTVRYLIQYCHEIGAALGPFNVAPEE